MPETASVELTAWRVQERGGREAFRRGGKGRGTGHVGGLLASWKGNLGGMKGGGGGTVEYRGGQGEKKEEVKNEG